jgi:hypothetical protein
MKKKLLILNFISLFTLSNAQINNGLKAHYTFSGNPNDTSGQNHNGQIIGNISLVQDRFGTPSAAYQFPGNAANYISINYAADFNIAPTDSFSISLWYKGGSSQAGDLEVLFGKENPQLINYHKYDYFLSLYDSNRLMCGGAGYEVLWSSVTPQNPDNNWHHAVLVYENKNWYLYLDNILDKSNTTQNNIITQSTNNLLIGKGFQGILDDIRFYNRRLSVGEINELYNLTGLSTNENKKVSKIRIYPNPVKNIIHITSGKTVKYVHIYDTSGRSVKTDTKNKINVSQLPNGSYIINVQTEDGEWTEKFIKE